MKKAIAVTAAVFLVSSVLTVVFAVALGASGIRSLFDGRAEAYIDRVIDRAEQLDDKFDDLDDKIDDKFHSDFDFDDDFSLTLSKHDELEANKESVALGFDAAEITVVRSDGGSLSVDLNEYSAEGSGEHFQIQKNVNGYDFYIKKLDDGGEAKVTVSVPESVKNIKIDVDAGDAEIKDIAAESLVVEMQTGETELERVKANDCKINAQTGKIKIDALCEFKRFEANGDTGKISYELAQGGNIKVSYSANLGSVSAQDGLSGFVAYDENGKRTGALAKSGRLESENADQNACEIILTVGTGSIEFENEIG